MAVWDTAEFGSDQFFGRQYDVVVVMKTHSLKKLVWTIAIAGAALVPGGYSDAGDPPRKVVICHKGQTLEVAEPAVQAHLDHGDTLGACEISPGQNR